MACNDVVSPLAINLCQSGIEFQCSISIEAACSGCEHIHQWPASAIVAVVALTDVAT